MNYQLVLIYKNSVIDVTLINGAKHFNVMLHICATEGNTHEFVELVDQSDQRETVVDFSAITSITGRGY